MPMEQRPANATLTSLRQALRVLKCFTVDEPERGVTEIARYLQVSKSTVHRVLATLEDEGYVRKDEDTHRYRLGLSVLSLSGILMSNLEIYREGQHLLEAFANRFDEAVHLAVLEGLHTVYVSKIESTHPVKILTHLGRQNPIHCTSSGKVILAHQKQEMVDEVIHMGLHAYAPDTMTNPEEFLEHLRDIRERGYATSHGELQAGVSSVAVPVRDYSRQVVGAVTVVGPTQRFTLHKVQLFARQLTTVGQQISTRLGYYERRRP